MDFLSLDNEQDLSYQECKKIYFDPAHAKAGICTCGGLCPGLNDVIRAIVRCLNTRYGVKTIKGYQYGFHGFFAEEGYEPIELDRYLIDEIHKIGGTYLGTSRGGGQRVEEIVDCLEISRDSENLGRKYETEEQKVFGFGD